MGRVVVYGGDEGSDGLAGVDDAFNPCDFTTLETLAFTRTAGLVEAFSGARRAEGGNGGVGWNEPPVRRAPVRETSSVEVKERCLGNSCGARETFDLDIWTSIADLEDEGTLVWPRDCLNGDGGRVVVDFTIEFSVFDDEVDRPTTMVALLLTLAFIREAGSADVDERDLVLNGEGGRE